MLIMPAVIAVTCFWLFSSFDGVAINEEVLQMHPYNSAIFPLFPSPEDLLQLLQLLLLGVESEMGKYNRSISLDLPD